jgi:protein-tyrosine-phosphatase/predicted ATP-grasp superfamily ATP-dependent carboligase
VSEHPEKVLVLGAGVSAFLAVIRSLGRRGIDVHVAWCQPDCPALRSRYVARYHRLPLCAEDDNWADAMAALLEQERFALVLPTNEQSARALHSRRRRFEPHTRLQLPEERIFETVFDKSRCGKLAEELQLRVPKTRVVSQPDELEALSLEWKYPLVLKPISSYDAALPTERRNVVKAYDREELERCGRRLLQTGAVVVQENFIGRGVGVELLVDHGRVLLAFQHERVHQPLRGGASTYRKSVPLDDELLEASQKLVAALDYSGVIMIEFLVDPPSRDWRFVEVNARFWGSLPLAVAAGADFPYALFRHLLHGQRDFPRAYRQGLYCRNLLSDGLWFWDNLRADRRDPTLATVSPLAVLLEARHFLAGQERFDALALDDPLPAAAEVVKYARRFVGRASLRLRRAWASLPGVRQRQSARARRALGRARQVIFLCWGNICRSPFAAAYARQLWPAQVEVLSRGLHYQQKRIAPVEALEAARVFDIALADHRSSLLSRQDVARADMIVCFDELILKELRRRHPQARSKAFRFGMLRARGPVGVPDPFGADLSTFRRVYVQIKETLDESRAFVTGARPDDEPVAALDESLPK